MKLRNYTLALLAVCALASCGEDDVPKIEVPDLTPDATLSIAAIPDGKIELRAATKAEAVPNLSERIAKLTVLIFSADGTFEKMADLTATDDKSLTEIKDIHVRSGVAKVLVIANSDMTAANGKSLTEVLAMTTTLNKETHKTDLGFLTMSSRVFDVSIIRGKHNRMGYGNTVSADNNNLVTDPIKMYRSVARVQLSNLTLKMDKTIFGEAQSFVIDSVFVANVKSISKIASKDENGVLESTILPVDEAEQWWTGGCPDFTGEYKTIAKEKEQYYLGYRFTSSATSLEGYPYSDPASTVKDAFTLDKDNKSKEDAHGIGNFFYVYENSRKEEATMTKTGTQTLLVVKGTYTYIPAGTTETKIITNRYYTAIVNDGTSTFAEGVSQHTGIRRNSQYDLSVTITGPGSDNPYEKDAWAWVTAQVEVLPWGVIKIDEPDAN